MKSKLINLEEYIDINGIKQYLFHRGTCYDNPVMLFLHGGPGSVESVFAHSFQEKWEDIFTVVHWDQRGSGKTYLKNKDSHPDIDLLIEDLFQIIQYLKIKYHKEKIIILGHSWGCILGTTFIKKYPKDVAYYIGVGQVIDIVENEKVGYEKLKEFIIKANDKKSLKKLNSFKNYPADYFDHTLHDQCSKLRKIQGKYGLAVTPTFDICIKALKSSIFKFTDLYALLKSSEMNKNLQDYMGKFNLNLDSTEYEIPIYYISGDKDWQVCYTLSLDYFDKIEAPAKKSYLIPNAGHMTMMDQPDLFFDALKEINSKNNFIL